MLFCCPRLIQCTLTFSLNQFLYKYHERTSFSLIEFWGPMNAAWKPARSVSLNVELNYHVYNISTNADFFLTIRRFLRKGFAIVRPWIAFKIKFTKWMFKLQFFGHDFKHVHIHVCYFEILNGTFILHFNVALKWLYRSENQKDLKITGYI